MLSQELLTKCIGFAAQCGDMDAVAELTGILNDTYINPVEEKKRKTANKSGVVKVDIETGKEICRYATMKEANEALGLKKNNSGISDCMTRESHFSHGFKWYFADEWDAR